MLSRLFNQLVCAGAAVHVCVDSAPLIPHTGGDTVSMATVESIAGLCIVILYCELFIKLHLAQTEKFPVSQSTVKT